MIKRLFLSRKTVLAFILLVLLAVLLSYIIPQKFSTPNEDLQKWRLSHLDLLPFIDKLGLDHIYSTVWFASLLLLFLISMALSTYEQIKTSIKKTFGAGFIKSPHPPFDKGGQGGILKTALPEEELISTIKKQGYSITFSDETTMRFLKHPWGYWGNVLLHAGIVIVILSSLVIVLTEKRGVLRMVEGEIYFPGTKWLDEEKGLFAGNFILPKAFRLERVTPEFWDTDNLKQLTTEMSFIDSQGRIEKHVMSINEILYFGGIRIYPARKFGNAFFLEITDEKGNKRGEILLLPHPPKRDSAGYGDFKVEGLPYRLRAKYFADTEKKSIYSLNPLLVLRLDSNEAVIDEISLTKGSAKKLDNYMVRFVDFVKWEEVIFIRNPGIWGIFAGFFIIILGGGLIYFTPPRELYVIREDEGFSLVWRAAKFEKLYEDEYKRIVAQIQR